MKKFTIITVLVFVFFASIHIAFTLFFVLPEGFVPEKLIEKSNTYMNPLFGQGWALFAPAPKINRKVFVSYLKEDNTWSAWQDPFLEYKAKHWKTRVTGYYKLVLMQSTTLHNVYYENEENFSKKRVVCGNKNSGFYKALKYEVEQQLASHHIKPKHVRLLLMFSSVDKPFTKNYIYYFN